MDDRRPGPQFRVLGPLEVTVEGRPAVLGGSRQRLVLAALVVHANTAVSVDRLIDIVWGDEPPSSALTTLQKYVHRLRTAIDPGRAAADPEGRLVTRAPGYLLRVSDGDYDAARFEALVADAQRKAAGGDLPGAMSTFDEALGLWHGAALADFGDQDFARPEVARLEGLRAVAVEDRVEVALAAGRHAEVIGELEATISTWPLRERPRAQLMLALFRCRRHAEALRVYEAFRRHLSEEVGLEPSEALVDLADAIVLQKRGLDWSPPAGAETAVEVAYPAAIPRDRDGDSDAPTFPSGTVTFVFTDIEGSTRLFRRLGHRFVTVLERHRELLRAAVNDQHGVEVSAEGDGMFFAFDGAAAAIAASASGQRAIGDEPWDDGPIRVRMGVHTGEAAPHNRDYISLAVHQAARVKDAAHGGQVLASEATVAALGEHLPVGCSVRSLGPGELKDFDQPVELFQLCHADLDTSFPPPRVHTAPGERATSARALPEGLTPDEGPFVGRTADLEWLEVLWRRAQAGEAIGALVYGRAGVGKTRLVTHFAIGAHRDGAAVAYHRSVVPTDIPHPSSAGATPSLDVYDDLKARDLAAFIGQAAARPGRLAVGVTCEDCTTAEARTGHAVFTRELGGLTTHDIASLLTHGGRAAPVELVDAVLDETAGDPTLVIDFAGRLRDRDAAERLERALSRAGSVERDFESVHDDITGGVMRRTRLAAGSPAPGAGTCPYRGLARFEAADAGYFCGRERLIATLVARLAVARFVGVIGASGSGKSSLVRAGLVPAITAGALPGSERWRLAICTPGADPIGQLARALAGVIGESDAVVRGRLDCDPHELSRSAHQLSATHSGIQMLLVIDQFEELITACHDTAARERFVAALIDAVGEPDSPVAVVAVVRADYYGALAIAPELAALFEHSQVLVGAMSDAELHRAVTEPARRVGLAIDKGLADTVCRDAGGEPGALPLVSTALLETWARRDGNTLTVAAYHEAGGVRGALARLADDVYTGLDEHQQIVARQIFLRLAAPGEGSDDVRRHATREELPTSEDAEGVLAEFVERRLLVADDGRVEVAHEALLREWPRLRGWLETDREGRRLLAHLAVAAAEWDRGGRDGDALYRGARLSAAQDWGAAHAADLNTLERAFIDASAAAHDRALRAAQRTARGLRLFAAGLACLLVVALVAGLVAWRQSDRAHHQTSLARAQALLAQASRLGAVARLLGPDQTDLALLLAVEAYRLGPTNDTAGDLEAVLASIPGGLERVIRYPSASLYPALTSDGRLLVVPGQDGAVRLFDVRTGQPVRAIAGRGSPVAVAVVADGTVALGGNGSTVDLRNLATGAPVGPPIDVGGAFAYGFFGYGGTTRLYTVSSNGQLVTWDRTDPAHPRRVGPLITFPVPIGQIPVASVSPDGSLLSVGPCCAGSTQLFDARTGALVREFPGAAGGITPDGKLIVTSQTDRLAIWDVATGRPDGAPLTGFSGKGISAASVVISPDGARLAAGDADGTVRVFDLVTRKALGAPLALHASPSLATGFLPDGSLVTSGSDEAAVWSLGSRVPPIATALGGHTGLVFGTFVQGADEAITEGFQDLRLLQWRLDGTGLGPLLGGRVHYPLAVSPDGRTLAAATPDGRIALFDRATGTQLSVLDSGPGTQTELDWSRAGNVIAASGLDQTVLIWDVTDPRDPHLAHKLRAPGTLNAGTASLIYPFVSADGRHVGVGDDIANTVTMFDTGTGRALWTASFPGGIGQVAFSPDGGTLALTAGDDAHYSGGQVVFIDVASGARQRTLKVGNFAAVEYVQGGRAFITAVGAAAQLWDSATLEPIGTPMNMPPDTDIWFAATNADRTEAMLGSRNGSAYIWQLDPAQWTATACRAASRTLTRTEWQKYLGSLPYHPPCTVPAS